jgi:MAF protein
MPISTQNPGSTSLFEIILASTSPFRKQLLARLELPFQVMDPAIDEPRHAGESAAQSVERLSQEKAQAVLQVLSVQADQEECAPTLIIGSDQLCVIGDRVVGKPHTLENARRQLQQASGHSVEFVTGISVLHSATQTLLSRVIHNKVWFKELSLKQIDAYLHKERPLECAGSFKSEGLGIALFKRIEGDDPNALIGLPLIALCDLLFEHGLDVLSANLEP